MSFRCPTQGRMPSRSRERRREKREWEIKLKLVKRKQTKTFDVAVIGGGMAGICAAIASARGGARTVLIQNRPMPGGNASSEIRMHICGAGCQMAKQGVNETGILLELLLENKRLNPGFNYNLWDAILTDRVQSTPGLELWLNTHCFDAVTRDGRIREIECCQSTTEIRLTVRAEIFIDCTGHGTVGYFSGADWRTGFEGKDETGECDAPAHGGEGLMGNTLLFKAVDRGHPVPYRKPEWADSFSEADLANRIHVSFNGVLGRDGLHSADTADGVPGLPELYCNDYGYWWIELGGDSGDIIGKSERIRDELVHALWGIWDHIKNGGEHGAENFELVWCGIVPGTRDSRRLMGDYLLNEDDILSNRRFADTVAYGGWAMDIHTPGGLRDSASPPSRVIPFEGIYTIPYRCYYSRNIENLAMAGRIISATKLGMSSARVMATCAVGGQAIGTAAAMCIRYGCTLRELGERHMEALQQRLIRDDCCLPGVARKDPDDLARFARIRAESEADGCRAENVANGDNRTSLWRSRTLGDGQTLTLSWDTPQQTEEIRLIFDSDLSCDLAITLSSKKQARQLPTPPPSLVRDYVLTLWRDGNRVAEAVVHDSAQRLAIHRLSGLADRLTLRIGRTWGADFASVFGVSVYGKGQKE